LQAPTGSGKTLAALEPFLQAWERNDPRFPRKCFYVVPRRVLASQFYREYKAKAQARCPGMHVSIQTGDQSDDRRFNGDLIFCTIDQFLSSYLTMPYSLPHRLANVNAGALVGAYIVMDEFHLHDPSPTLPTALYVLKQLKQVAPILLMTATFSKEMLYQLAKWLDTDAECLSQDEVTQIDTDEGRRQARRRLWRVSDTPLTADAVLESHQHRSIALCNTVDRAQKLYRCLREQCRERGLDIEIRLLHSRFLPADRLAIEQEIIEKFGKDADRTQGSYIVVATQAIEVGLDITCEVLHTESAPASSLIQRAGRCARYASEAGTVIVYPVEKTLPYTDSQGEQVNAAYEWVRAHDNQVYTFEVEQQLVNDVASQHDQRVIDDLKLTQTTTQDNIIKILTTGDTAQAAQLLIRDADSRRLLIHPAPQELLADEKHSPYEAQGFGIAPTTLFKPFEHWKEVAASLNKPIEELVWRLEESDASDKENTQTPYRWKGVKDKKEFLMTAVIAISPLLANYNSKEGLVLDQGGDWQSSFVQPENKQVPFEYSKGYRLESYEEHIRLVLEAMNDTALVELERQMHALEQVAGWEHNTLVRAARLAALFHDVGKLSVKWQKWLRTYQAQINRPVPDGFRGAHTDSEKGNKLHEAASKSVNHLKSTHAVEGIVATIQVVSEILNNNEALGRATLSAMARHHAGFSNSFNDYQLVTDASVQIERTLKQSGTHLAKSLSIPKLLYSSAKTSQWEVADMFARPFHTCEWLAYLLLVRALRTADGEGTGRGAIH
jgi:CRISPR-associated endonuclease/helicase Cas3